MITDQIKTTFKFHDIQSLSNNRDIIDKVCTDDSNFINAALRARLSECVG